MAKYEKIHEKLKKRQQELERRIHTIRKQPGRMGQSVSPDFDEQALERHNDEVTDFVDKSTHEELNAVNDSLRRLQNNTYGICTKCGKQISERRLEALPFTDRCIDCASS